MILGIDASQANRKIKSGTEWYGFYLIQEFKKLLSNRGDWKIRLYTRDQLQMDLAENMPLNFEVRVLRWPFKYFWVQGRLSLEMLVDPPDILFCPAHTLPIIHPHQTFTTLHDLGFEDYPELYDVLSRWYHRWSARLAVKSAYHIFTVSKFSRERIFENYGCPKDKLTVTYLGIDPKRSAERKWSIGEKYGLREKNYLLYLGRLEPKKNILNIVKAYEMANISQELVLAGRKVYIKDLEDYLQRHPELKTKVIFLDYISEEDKAALYEGALIFLFPTLYEGFGLPIIEAQACGTAVVTSNTGSNAEIAGEGAMIVDPESPYEIAQAIKLLLTNEALRQEKISLGLQNVKRFNWQETASQTLQVMGILDQSNEL